MNSAHSRLFSEGGWSSIPRSTRKLFQRFSAQVFRRFAFEHSFSLVALVPA